MKASKGLFQKIDGGTWFVRRAVPRELWHLWKRERVASTNTADSRQAERRRDDLWRAWDADFAEARAGLQGSGQQQLLVAIDSWRQTECEVAVRGIVRAPLKTSLQVSGRQWAALREQFTSPLALDLSDLSAGGERQPVVDGDVELLSKRYFLEHPHASRSFETPPAIALLLGRLQIAARVPDGWIDVPQFDAELQQALHAGGITSRVEAHQMAGVREAFAKAWLEVERHREWQRQRAARYLAAVEVGQLPPQLMSIESRPVYRPREDDRSVRELITAYRAHRSEKFGAIDTGKKYNHIFRALEEALGPDTPIRSIDNDAAGRVKALIRRLPVHASKRYPGLSLLEAADRGAEDEIDLLAPNTARGYVVNMSAIFRHALKRKWVDENPVEGLIDRRFPKIERRSFTPAELGLIFTALAPFKDLDQAMFWVPAIGLYQGARAGEVCQMKPGDIKFEDGVACFDFTLFDETGRLDPEKRLKNKASARFVSIHPELIKAGILDVVARRKAEGARRLFPELPEGPNGGYSHALSKKFGPFLDRLGLNHPSVTMHSLRHNFRDAGRGAGIPDDVVFALGGWAGKGVGNAYGKRAAAVRDAPHLARIGFGEFRLVPE